jgi:hypothetical protein
MVARLERILGQLPKWARLKNFVFLLHDQRRYTQQREVSLGSKTALRSLHIRMYMSSHYFLVVSRYEATDDWPFSSVQ